MATATAADEFKLNFYQAIRDLMAGDPDKGGVLVTYGYPGVFDANDMIEFSDTTSNQTFGPMSSSNRARDETLTQQVFITCYRGGGQEQELVCAQRAYELLRMIEKQVRVTDTTVGGSVKYCFLTQHTCVGHTAPEILERGRAIEITATFTAEVRISNSTY